MNNLALVTIPDNCIASRCNKKQCSISLGKISTIFDKHDIVDLDCKELEGRDKKRCDYLFIGHPREDVINYFVVAPIELKGGRVDRATDVSKQLQGGADFADEFLPPDASFELWPILVKGKPIHTDIMNKLRRKRVSLRSTQEQIMIARCDSKLIDVFHKSKRWKNT